jgi:SM-20-related protein
MRSASLNPSGATPEAIADGLAEGGFCVCPDFLPAAHVAALARDARQQIAAFQPGGTGARHERDLRVRGDSTLWLDPPGASEPQQQVLARYEALRLALNRTLQLGLFDLECHYALYPPGTCYRRHRDRLTGEPRFTGQGERVLSCVLYLNQGWRNHDGGELRLYLPRGAPLDIQPVGGTLVVFLSERFEHEVLAAQRERLSLTGWFRQRPA